MFFLVHNVCELGFSLLKSTLWFQLKRKKEWQRKMIVRERERWHTFRVAINPQSLIDNPWCMKERPVSMVTISPPLSLQGKAIKKTKKEPTNLIKTTIRVHHSPMTVFCVIHPTTFVAVSITMETVVTETRARPHLYIITPSPCLLWLWNSPSYELPSLSTSRPWPKRDEWMVNFLHKN